MESAVAVEPPTRPVPPSTSTRALGDFLFLLVEASVEGESVEGAAADEVAAAAGGARALQNTADMVMVAILPVARAR